MLKKQIEKNIIQLFRLLPETEQNSLVEYYFDYMSDNSCNQCIL